MANLLSCPETQELHRFLTGQLPEPEADQLQQHLSQCGQCLETLHTLQADDPLADAIRAQGRPVARPEDAAIESLIRKLAAGPPPAPDVTADGGDTPSEAGAVKINFLAPPQGPEELGRLGPYRVLRVLGAGGMGVVFEAEDPRLQRRVALKAMRPALAADPVQQERFLQEGRAAAGLEHDHIITVHDVGEDHGIPYLAMQLLHGESLEERLRRAQNSPQDNQGACPGALPIAEAVRIAREVAEGLLAAHHESLTHRDIKPANIWLEANEERDKPNDELPLSSSSSACTALPRVKLLDFGLARAAHGDVHLTQLGMIIGTPAYMAPEQANGEPADARSDLFSLGCVLYRMCTGQLPFPGANTMAVLRALAVDKPRPVRQLNPAVPAPLARLIEQLLAKAPNDRPQTTQAVIDALADVERKRSEAAKPWTRRWLPLALAAALSPIILGLGYFYGPTVYRFTTNEGQLIIETDDEDVEVTVRGEQVKTVDLQTGKQVNLKAGTYEVELTRAQEGLRLSTREFTLGRGGKQVVHVVRLSPEEVAAAAQASVPSEPFVILANGERAERKSSKLAEAVEYALSGDTIEIRGNGPFVTEPIRRALGKALVLRAGAGFRPVIVPDPKYHRSQYLLFSQGPLVLEGIEFKSAKAMPQASCVTSHGAPLHIANCRITWFGPVAISATECPRLQLRNCQLVGTLPIAVRPAFSGRVQLENNLVAETGSAAGLDFIRGQPVRHLSVSLTNNTFSGSTAIRWRSDLFAATGADPQPAKAVHFDNSANVFKVATVLSSAPSPVYPRISLAELPASIEKRIEWLEHGNCYSDQTESFLSLSSKGSYQAVAVGLDDWNLFWNLKDTQSSLGRIRWQGGDAINLNEGLSELPTPDAFRLKPESAGYRAGANGGDLGTDVGQAGPGPAYERWKNTAAYQRWLKETDQVPAELPPAAKSFVVLANKSQAEQPFVTLAEAVAEAERGATIEVRGDGPFVSRVIPQIKGKALTIRAAASARPVLRCEDPTAPERWSFLSTDSDLVLEGLELWAPTSYSSTLASMVKSVPPRGSLYIVNCRFHLIDGCGITMNGPVSVMRNCEFYGRRGSALSMISVTEGLNQEASIDNCIIKFECLLTMGKAQAGQFSRARLTGNTFRGTYGVQLLNGARLTQGKNGPADKPHIVQTAGNLFEAVMLLRIALPADNREAAAIQDPNAAKAHLRQTLDWSGGCNVYGLSTVLCNLPYCSQGVYYSAPMNLATWKSFWGASESGCQQGKLLYGEDQRVRAPEEIGPADFRLQPDSAGKGAGPGGRDLGADVDLVGPGAAYERWKKTPAHLRWPKDTGPVKAEVPAPPTQKLEGPAPPTQKLEGPAPTNATPTPPVKPFIILAKANQQFATLAEAVAASGNGDIIEVRGNGPFVTRQISHLLYPANKLTIRAGTGFTPVFCVDPESPGPQFIHHTGPLVLEGLEIQRLCASEQKVFNGNIVMCGSGALQLTHCRFVVRQASQALCFHASLCPLCEVRNCQFVCGPGINIGTWTGPTGARFHLENNWLVRSPGGADWGLWLGRDNREVEHVSIRLKDNTMVGTNIYPDYYLHSQLNLPVGDGQPATPSFRLETSGNIFDVPKGLLRSRVNSPAAPGAAEAFLKRVVAWNEQNNLYPDDISFLNLSDRSGPIALRDAPRTVVDWQKFWGKAGAGSLQGRIRYQGGDLAARAAIQPESLTAADCRLVAGNAGKGAGEGGRDLGADVDLVGPGKAYEDWKKTPAYQQWLKDTGQIK